ncbi:MAG: esterase [Chitinophagales bacterium]|nr:MAG: esterase [Chitinophagales bacterium]
MNIPIQEHHIPVMRTARYCTLGIPSASTHTVWFACHGYGQLAADFIQQLKPLHDEKTWIVAPEGLSRFYVKGFFGKTGASWMTREDRLHEISDYLNYLEKLREHILGQSSSSVQLKILGFSQGVSTVCRWVTLRNPRPAAIWLCSGNIPDDIDKHAFRFVTQSCPVHLLVGKKDPLIRQTDLETALNHIEQHQWNIQVTVFEGAHEVNAALIKIQDQQNHLAGR